VTAPHDRRQFLKGAAALAGTALLDPAAVRGAAAPASPSPVAAENARPGTRDWQLTRVRLDRTGGFRSPAIEGYCSRQSVRAGENLEFFVSANPATRFTLEIFRMGFYAGRGARLITTLGPFPARPQPEPEVGPQRLRACRWEPSAALTVPGDWLSGVYLGRLTTQPGAATTPYWQSYVIFIVRDDRPADLVFQCSDNTWQAYNRWPDAYSLYTDPRGAWATGVAVSFDRPYGKYAQIFEAPQSVGSGEFLLWEFPLVYWLEQHGYDVTYVSNRDCLEPAALRRGRAFVSAGHDEYWDVRQYDAVQAALAGGVSLLWFCGNSVFGVSPFSPAPGGAPDRVLTRTGIYGGMTDREVESEVRVFTREWRRDVRDESRLIGARSIVPFNGGGDWTCVNPAHWIFAGTGMRRGEAIPGLVGWEHHGAPADLPGLEVVAEGTAWSGGTRPAHWTATVFPGPRNGIVFNAATIFWAQGLSAPPGHQLPWSHGSRPHGPDERVQAITRNVLQRALRG
jgi:hypothetical protein